jgi:hypothetical protein
LIVYAAGFGVYASKNPNVALGYSAGSNSIILAKGLIRSEDDGSPAFPNVNSGDGVVIFRDPSLIIPVYLITFG